MAEPDKDSGQPGVTVETPAFRAVRAVLARPGGDKLSTVEVAIRAGVSESTVLNVRKGGVSPRMTALQRLRQDWANASAEEKRQFLDEVIREGR
jgi:transcriptional regulator with XRE-family HTH domain